MTWARTAGGWLLVSVLACTLSGCATIVSGRKCEVTMNNSGGPTYFTVLDNKNQVVHSGVTPQQVTLKSSSGPFQPARYQVVYASQDEVQQYEVNTSINWWTAGNIVVGGVPGLVVDAASGALWKLEPAVTGKIPANAVVSDATQGAAVLAAYSGSRSSIADDTAMGAQQEKVRQASFYSRPSTEKPVR